MNKYLSIVSWIHIKLFPLFTIPVLLLDIEKQKIWIAISFGIFFIGLLRLYSYTKRNEVTTPLSSQH